MPANLIIAGKKIVTLSPVTMFQVCTRSLGATHGPRLNKRVLMPCDLNRCMMVFAENGMNGQTFCDGLSTSSFLLNKHPLSK